MSRPGVTYQEVAAAATQLMSQGRNPTIEQIRHILGTGSSTTLANHLKQWKEKQNGTSLIAARENIPEELVSMLQGLWQRVIDTSEEKMAAVAADLEQRLQVNTQELEKYRHNNQRWQQLFNQWSKEKEGLTQENAELNEKTQSLEKEKAALFSTLTGQRQQLQEKQDRIDELFRLHKLAQSNLEYDRESEQEKFLLLQKHNDTLEKQYSKTLSDLTMQSSQLLSTEDALKQKIIEVNHCQSEIKSLQQQLTNAQNLNEQLEQEKWRFAQEKAQLEGQLKERGTQTEKDLVMSE